MRKLIAAAALFVAAVPARADTVLTYAAHYNGDEMAPLTACFRAYEAQNPGVTIRYQQTPIADFLQTVQTSRIAGTTPDIMNVYSIWGPTLVGAGVLAEPPAEVAAFVKDNFEPSTVSASTIDGVGWGVPAEVSLYLLVYNKALFAAAGIAAPPATWDELAAAAAKIAKRDELGRVTTAGYAFGPTVANATHPFRALMSSAGVPLFPGDATTNLASPEAVGIVAAEGELFRTGATSAANKWQDFASGGVGMFIGANWFEKTLRDGLGDTFDETVGVAPIPGGPEWRTYQYSFYLAVGQASRNKDAAWALVRWLNEPREDGRSCVGRQLVALGALTANRADVEAFADELGDAFTKPYVDALAAGRAEGDPAIPGLAAIDKILRAEIEEVWLGRKDAATAMADADAAARAVIARGN